jgi:hypothetical protein
MPTFKFLNTETNEEFEDFLTNSRKEELLEKNPHIKQMPTGFGIVSTVGSIDSKTDNTWKEVLAKVAEAHPTSQVANRYGKRTIKQARSAEVIRRHVERWRKI